jgi:hypothetical protein
MRAHRVKIFAFALIAMLLITPKARSWNDASRMATIQSLVEKQTFVIDDSAFVDTSDKIYINGHYYSDKPAMTSIMGALIYLPLFHFGIELDQGWNLAYYLITLFTVKIFWLLGLLAFYFTLGFSKINDRNRLWVTFALGIASLHLTWSSTLNNHSLAASLLIIGFYFLLKSSRSVSIKRDLFLAGFFMSFAGTVDVPTVAFYVGFLLYILIDTNLRGKSIFYLLPLMLTVLPALSVNYYISGSLIPVQIKRVYFDYPGSPWISSNVLSGIQVNQGVFLLVYSFTSLLGPRGFLLYNPLLLIALPCLIREIRKGQPFRREALVIVSVSLIIVSYYLLFTNDYGGRSYSIRWFVPLLPLLFFFIHPFFEVFTLKRRRIFMTLFSISTVIACIGMINPWSNNSLSEIPLLSNIKALMIYFLY